MLRSITLVLVKKVSKLKRLTSSATVVVILLSVLAMACSSNTNKKKDLIGPIISSLPDTILEPAVRSPINNEITLDKVEAAYQKALNSTKDPVTRRTILIRLANILMLKSEDQMLASNSPGRFFGAAIKQYRELIELQKQPSVDRVKNQKNDKNLDQILYQLSKAYTLDGDLNSASESLDVITKQYQDSAYFPEANFRRAEQAFSAKNYVLSEKLFKQVITEGVSTPFYQNALYMHGWSQFKRNNYEASIDAFIKVLDHFYGTESSLKLLTKSQQNVVDDTLRVTSLAFDYLDGVETLSKKFAGENNRYYVANVYLALGKFYFNKNRFRDSANAYRQYVIDNSLADDAPVFSGYVIDVYEKGDFPSLLIPAKQEYAVGYGIDSEYWKTKSLLVRESLSVNLKQYIEELAKYEHAKAQGIVTKAVAVEKAKSKDKKKDSRPFYVSSARNNFLKASSWYDQFIRTFPQDNKTPDMYLLMAEALNDANELTKAFDTYTHLAYQYELPADKKLNGANAGYAAVVLAQTLIERSENSGVNGGIDNANKQLWQNRFIDQSLAFADNYSEDPRAVNVMSVSAERLLQSSRQPEAVLAATRVTNWQPQASASLRRTAWLVLGQSEFDLLNYVGSEQAYEQALLLTSKASPERGSLVDRRAASVYKYGEALLVQAGQQQAAIDQLLRIQTIAPDSAIAKTAQYDAGNQLIKMQQWPRAEAVLLDFRKRYPQDSLTKTLNTKLVVVYQATEQWALAGNELTVLSTTSDDPILRQQSLLLAAELYSKSGQVDRSITSYEQYIKQYPQPIDELVEAINRLAILFKDKNNTTSYEYWRKQSISTHDTAGRDQTDRSLYLAVSAQSYFSQKNYQNFIQLRLTLPLKTSLRKKQQALSLTVASYQKVINYGVIDFVTEANFYLGESYIRLSSDLLSSERPEGLSGLAREQYEVLLEEQIYPFEEKAIGLHKSNAARAKNYLYDEWVQRSFASLAKLSPGQFNKPELRSLSRELY
jgi:TolA-binding protein